MMMKISNEYRQWETENYLRKQNESQFAWPPVPGLKHDRIKQAGM